MSLDFNNWTCPLPLRDYPKIVLGHGGGGKLSNELIENLFLPAFSNETLEELGKIHRRIALNAAKKFSKL